MKITDKKLIELNESRKTIWQRLSDMEQRYLSDPNNKELEERYFQLAAEYDALETRCVVADDAWMAEHREEIENCERILDQFNATHPDSR